MLNQNDLAFVLGNPAPQPPSPETVAPAAPEVQGTSIPQALSNAVEATTQVGKQFGIDTNKLGLTRDEIAFLTDIHLPPPNSVLQPKTSFEDVQAGGSSTASITPSGLSVSVPETLDSTKNNFLDTALRTTVDFGKSLVQDVQEGVVGYGDLWRQGFASADIGGKIINLEERLKADPGNLAIRAELKGLKEQSDEIDAAMSKDLWDVGTAATMFIPFGGPVKIGAKAAEMVGAKALAEGALASLEKRGLKGVGARLLDRAGKGTAMGGAYGYMSSQGDLDQAKQSAETMGALFGAGPAIAAPLKSVMGAAGKGTARVVNAFTQIPAVASTRKAIYDGPVGKTWDYLATRTGDLFDRHGLKALNTNFHLARIEAVRMAGSLVKDMEQNLKGLDMEAKEQVSALMERRLSPQNLIDMIGADKARPLIRKAAEEARRLKGVGQLLKAYGVPTHNSATGDWMNFVLKKNFMPHFIPDPAKLLTDPKLRAQSIEAIRRRTGKSVQEATEQFEQWAVRAQQEQAASASSGAMGRAHMEARLYGLPGYSMDLPNVLNVYYQKAARLIANHRRLGRAVKDVNGFGPGDDAAAAMANVPSGAPGQQLDLFSEVPASAGGHAAGDAVTVAGKNGPIPGTVVNPSANAAGQVRVRVGEPGKTKVLTVSPSKVEKAVAKNPELKGLKKGSQARLSGKPVTVKGTTPGTIIVEDASGKEIAVPKDSQALSKMKKARNPKMVAAAVQLPDGTVETGMFHAEIYDRLGDAVGDNAVDGFVDKAGKFYTREQAMSKAPSAAEEMGRLAGKEFPDVPDMSVEVPPPPMKAAGPGPDEIQVGVQATGGQMTVAELRKALKAEGYTPQEIGDIVKGMQEMKLVKGTIPAEGRAKAEELARKSRERRKKPTTRNQVKKEMRGKKSA